MSECYVCGFLSVLAFLGPIIPLALVSIAIVLIMDMQNIKQKNLTIEPEPDGACVTGAVVAQFKYADRKE